MDIEYQDVISVTTFKAAAVQSVTDACVSSEHPAAEESSPVHIASSSSHLTLMWAQAASRPLLLLLLLQQGRTLRLWLSPRRQELHPEERWEVKTSPSEVASSVICSPESASQMWAGRRWGFYGEIKEKPRRLSPAQLTFQVRGWCWLQPANWRHIWEMSRRVPNGLSQARESWSKRDLQWLVGPRSRTACCLHVKHDAEHALLTERSSNTRIPTSAAAASTADVDIWSTSGWLTLLWHLMRIWHLDHGAQHVQLLVAFKQRDEWLHGCW